MTSQKGILLQEAYQQLQSGEGNYTPLEQFIIRLAQPLLDNPKLTDIRLFSSGGNISVISADYHSEHGTARAAMALQFVGRHSEKVSITEEVMKHMEDNFDMHQSKFLRDMADVMNRVEERLKAKAYEQEIPYVLGTGTRFTIKENNNDLKEKQL